MADKDSELDLSKVKSKAKPVKSPIVKVPTDSSFKLAKTSIPKPDSENIETKPVQSPAAAPHPIKPKKVSRPLVVKVVIIIVAIIVVIVAVFAVLIYAFASTSSVTYAASKIIPYPAERVNGHFVLYRDYIFEVNANQKAYVSNAKLNNQPAVSWTSADGKKLLKQIKQHALTKLEDDSLTAQLATKYKVSVSDKDIDTLINTLYQKYGGKDTLLKTLAQIYGWNLTDLRHVIAKQLLAQKVQSAVTSDPAIDRQIKAKAEDVLTKLKTGADFAATAKQYSQASDASSGGDLGSVNKGQVEDVIYTAAMALQPGSLSDVIKSQYGYQIIKVVDKTDSSVHLQHVLIKNVDYTEYFSTQEKAAKVKTFIKTS